MNWGYYEYKNPQRAIIYLTIMLYLQGVWIELLFSSHPDSSKCPSEKEHKKYEAESDEFQRNSSGPASFFAAATQACIPVPSHQSHLSNPEKDRENRKKAWFIRLRWKDGRDGGRRGLEAETDAEVIEYENWKLNIEENVVGLPLWKGKEAWFFLVPEGRFSGGQEGDSWWDENNGLKCRKPVFMRVFGICFIKWLTWNFKFQCSGKFHQTLKFLDFIEL